MALSGAKHEPSDAEMTPCTNTGTLAPTRSSAETGNHTARTQTKFSPARVELHLRRQRELQARQSTATQDAQLGRTFADDVLRNEGEHQRGVPARRQRALRRRDAEPGNGRRLARRSKKQRAAAVEV